MLPARKIHVSIALILSISCCNGQGENNTWYFGYHAGLDFNNGAPVLLTNGQTDYNFGAASVCDKNGILLFYTDGTRVWSKQHTLMPNGTGLAGSLLANSVIIVPAIDDETRYYIFTLDAYARPNGFNYSVVNMQLDNGRGDVETKNTILLDKASEHLTAIPHCNGKDIWVIMHEWNSDAFRAYLVSNTGISPNPIISHIGPLLNSLDPTGQTNPNSLGTIKGSLDGAKLAATFMAMPAFYLFDFDNAGGVISNSRIITAPGSSTPAVQFPFGVEFSADSRLLYMAGDSIDVNNFKVTTIFQFDISSGNAAQISNSRYNVTTVPLGNAGWGGSLQMGPDGKIYFSRSISSFVTGSPNEGISVIENPSIYGSGCSFLYNIIPMPPGYASGQNLPQRVPPRGLDIPAFVSSQPRCGTWGVQFYHERPAGITAIQWNFDDPSSGANNIATVDSPLHIFSAPGIYDVTVVRFTACRSDTILLQVIVRDLQVNLGKDTTACNLDLYLLDPVSQSNDNIYLWQDGSSAPVFPAMQTGLYWVQVTDTVTGCRMRDSIQLVIGNYPQIDLGNDTMLPCTEQPLQLSVNIPGASYLWSTGSTENSITVLEPGTYSLHVNLQGCITKDSIKVSDRICDVFVPSAFTPNADGKNDVFRVIAPGSVTNFILRVYNRWGEVVFETNDPQKEWNGTYKGKRSAADNYVYLVLFTDRYGTKRQLKGNVALIR